MIRARLLRGVLGLAMLALLGGCASDCNILSSSNSRSCDAMLVGGMILTAPIMIPAALISDAASDAKSKRVAAEWKASMQTRLAENDLEAIQECLLDCERRGRYEIEYAEIRQMELDAARRFIHSDWPQLEPIEYQVFKLQAHYIQAWTREGEGDNRKLVLVPEHVKASYALLADESLQPQLRKQLGYTRHLRVSADIYGMNYSLSAPINDKAQQDYYQQCPQRIGATMFTEEPLIQRIIVCNRAYTYHFQEPVPSSLRKQWDESERQRDRT